MRRSLLLVLCGILAAVAILYGLRLAGKSSEAAIFSLLPRETIALVHVPNFNRTRHEWRRSDLYKLYTEPAVQDFLRKPLAQMPSANSATQALREIEELDPKDAFWALVSMANENPAFVGGFRFRGNQSAAEAVIDKWRSQLLGASARGERIGYEQHNIDVVSSGRLQLSTVYNRQWFFVSNDVAQLKALLDRVDGRVKDGESTLERDDSFRAAMAEMPANYAGSFYLQPKVFAEKLASLRTLLGQPAASDQRTLFEQIRSICAATRFDNGKMRDVIFVAMPKIEQGAELNRSSATLGTKDTFLYVASVLNLSKQLALLEPPPGSVLGPKLQGLGAALAAAGITKDDFQAAFGSELGMLADWPPNARWPAFVTTFPVKDAARARKIVDVLARAGDHDAVWEEADRDGVHYLSIISAPGFIAFHPAIGISDQLMIVGLDLASVETAMRRSKNSASELANSPAYRQAAKSVPEPTNFFAYIDMALLYSRLDTALRPILLMGAAFLPTVNDHIDLSKLPSAEIITKHLSPIASSQRYKNNGYVTESVGPVTLNQSGIAILMAVGVGARVREMTRAWNVLLSPSASPTPIPFSASPSPTGTP